MISYLRMIVPRCWLVSVRKAWSISGPCRLLRAFRVWLGVENFPVSWCAGKAKFLMLRAKRGSSPPTWGFRVEGLGLRMTASEQLFFVSQSLETTSNQSDKRRRSTCCCPMWPMIAGLSEGVVLEIRVPDPQKGP